MNKSFSREPIKSPLPNCAACNHMYDIHHHGPCGRGIGTKIVDDHQRVLVCPCKRYVRPMAAARSQLVTQ